MPRGHSYSKEQIFTALTLYNKLQSMPKVVELLGYPSVSMLSEWKHMYPELVTSHKRKAPRSWVHASFDLKMHAIHRCINNGETIKSVAEDIGYSSVAVLKWIHEYTEKGNISLMNQSDPNIPIDPKDIQSAEDIETLKAQMIEMQMEIDILKETINVLKKDPGVNQEALSNREKAVIIDALRNKYSLPKLCRKLCMSRSSYYYQETTIHAEEKYREVRIKICELFHNNYDAFGYRKIYALLKREGITLSEKVVRRIMQEERLIVKVHHRRKYNSYKGEISPAVENLINRDFHADKPNQKWLTDITEFSIEAGQKIGTFLKELRKEKGMTQEQLAEKLNVSRRTVSRWETGNNMPDLDLLMELADLYEVDLREMLNGERKSEDPMNKEIEETVLQVAEYSNAEKQRDTMIVLCKL